MTNETVIPATATMTRIQARVAHKLAAVHNHHWAVLSEEEVVGLTSEEIGVMALEREEPGFNCLFFRPVFDEDGNIVHTTGSGRLTWRVGEEGHVWLAVTRPPLREGEESREVMYFSVPVEEISSFDGELASVSAWAYVEGAGERHLDAVVGVLKAMVGLNVNAEAALGWLETQRSQARMNDVHALSRALDRLPLRDDRDFAIAVSIVARRFNSADPAIMQIRSQLMALAAEMEAVIQAR